MGVPRLVLGFLKFRISIVEAVRLHGCASAGFRIFETLNFELSEFKLEHWGAEGTRCSMHD